MTVIAGRDQVPYRWFVKWVGTVSKPERKVRLIRIVWSRKGGPGDGTGWSSKLSVNLRPRFVACSRDSHNLYVTLLGVQLHYQRHWGGWIS